MAEQKKILICEQDHKNLISIEKCLEEWGYAVTSSTDTQDAIKKIDQNKFSIILSDFEISFQNNHNILKYQQKNNPDTKLIFMSNKASVENAVDAMRLGAFDFLQKPIGTEQLQSLLQLCFEKNGAKQTEEKNKKSDVSEIVTQDTQMLNLVALVQKVADSRASILIQGESGTGKEMFARLIHAQSQRRAGPFIAVNCGALPETLLESELFGHEKGAYTGAVSMKPGKFELAGGGTILLDEITEMQIHLQSKLLRVIQEREVDRVGGTKPIKVDVRILATTNRDVHKAIEAGEFREDLYYRLNVIPLHIPPLRSRSADIPFLAEYFIKKYNDIDDRNVKGLTSAAKEKLMEYPFKGNVRELENIIERALLLTPDDYINENQLFINGEVPDISPQVPPKISIVSETTSDIPTELTLKEVEKKIIFHTLDKTDGNRTHAAKILGISVRTLRNKLNEYKDNMNSL